jgi:signal transduction histidine kinase
MFQQKAIEENVTLDFMVSQTAGQVQGDERLLRQVALNLISNSMKFTPSGGRVTISVSVSLRDGVLLKVQDTGIGIAKENIERVLRPFEQVESSLARSHGGTGLGLPYSKKVIEIHGGSLVLESALNRGTTVTVRLPARRVFANAPAASEPRLMVVAG